MPAKSFIGSVEEAARVWYATVVRQEVSDANVRAYLAASWQIADFWQATDAALVALMQEGTAPWDAYDALRYPIALVRIARAYQIVVEQLLAMDAAADPATRGFLPRVTYDQANALCHHLEPTLQAAAASLADPHYQPPVALPISLGPRIVEGDHPHPIPHLQGLDAAARDLREWAIDLSRQYSAAFPQATEAVPAGITAHLAAVQRRLAEADAQLDFGMNLLNLVEEQPTSAELSIQAAEHLWSALDSFFLLNQVVALARWPFAADSATQHREHPKTYRNRRVKPADLWRLAAPSARASLRETKAGKAAMQIACSQMGGVLSVKAQRYLAEVELALQRREVQRIGAMAHAPFEPLYRARVPLDIGGVHIAVAHEFHWDFPRDQLEVVKRFTRDDSWQTNESEHGATLQKATDD